MATSREIEAKRKQLLERLRLYKSGAVQVIDESPELQQNRIAQARKDVEYFVSYYFPDYAQFKSAPFQIDLAKKVKKNPSGKFIVRWGRGLAKSVWCDLFIPLWLWINKDIDYMVIVGNNLDKAKILLADLQAEFTTNPKLIHDFGEQKMLGSWEDGYFTTKSGFTAKALGMGQSPRGLRMKNHRPDYIVCDDLEDKDTVKNPKRQDEIVDWIDTALLATMDGDKRRYLHPNNNFAPRTIQQELWKRHKDTPDSGWLLHQVDAYDANYKPAWTAKYSDTYYQEVENEMGTLAARSEFNNQPHIRGKVFTKEQIIYPPKYPRMNQFTAIVGHWDIAYSGNYDFNAVRVWGLYENNFYYIDSFVRQKQMWDALEFIAQFTFELCESASVHWQYEAAFWNEAVEKTICDFEETIGSQLYLCKVDTPRTKKLDRILRLQPYYQRKKVFYPESKEFDPDHIEGLQQLYGIEPGYSTHDDAPDADEQAIAYLEQFIRSSKFKARTGKYNQNNKRKY